MGVTSARTFWLAAGSPIDQRVGDPGNETKVLRYYFKEQADALRFQRLYCSAITPHPALPIEGEGSPCLRGSNPSKNAGIEAALRVAGGEQLSEPVLAHHQVLRRQFAVLEELSPLNTLVNQSH